MIQFKHRDGEWQVYGPAGELTVGEVEVTKKSGEVKTVWVEHVQPARSVRGVEMAYGLIGNAPQPALEPVATELALPAEAPAVDAPWACDGTVAIGRSDSTAGDLFAGTRTVSAAGEIRTMRFDQDSITTVGYVDGVRMVAVTVSEVPEPRQQRKPRRRPACDECGRSARKLVECTDSSGIGGLCCPRCASMSPHELSFA